MTNPFIDTVIQSLLDGGTMEMEGETYRLIRADQPAYRIRFPNPGDGTRFSADDIAEMETLNYGLEDAIEAGVLVRIGGET